MRRSGRNEGEEQGSRWCPRRNSRTTCGTCAGEKRSGRTCPPVHLTEDEDTGDRFLLYATDAGVQVQLKYEGDDLLMTQPQMADLFGVTRQNVNLHLNNIHSEGELDREATSKDSLQVRQEGTRKVKRAVTLFTLDAIIAVGYRVSTKQGTLFRKWRSTSWCALRQRDSSSMQPA